MSSLEVEKEINPMCETLTLTSIDVRGYQYRAATFFQSAHSKKGNT